MSKHRYWIKPLGVTTPRESRVPDDWLSESTVDGDQSLGIYRIRSGPPEYRRPPEPGPHQRVFLHAVGYALTFAEGELISHPEPRGDFGAWGKRWPWGYDIRIDHWVPSVSAGVPSRDLFPLRAIGRIQSGADFAGLTQADYETAIATFTASPNVRHSQG